MSRSRRLSRVLRIREVEEELARVDWLALEGRARAAEDEESSLRLACADMTTELAGRLPELSPEWVVINHDGIDRAQRRVARQHVRATTLRTQADAALAPWQERRAAVRGLARLVDRARAHENAEAIAAEARTLDELTAARGNRTKRSEG